MGSILLIFTRNRPFLIKKENKDGAIRHTCCVNLRQQVVLLVAPPQAMSKVKFQRVSRGNSQQNPVTKGRQAGLCPARIRILPDPGILFGIAAVIIALSAGYFLVKRVLAPVKQPDRQV